MSGAEGWAADSPRGGRDLALSFYGDDFTGSTDVMEALELAGVPTVLFLEAPTTEQLAKHPDALAVGVAGIARAMTPDEMDEALPPIFERIAALGAPLFHYKVCSTFDSSPRIGSIGRAAELLRDAFGAAPVPVVVGVPELGRYTAFGQLFATADGRVHRIDRHPTMMRHPSTPMTEADLLVHLGRQTDLRGGLVDIRALESDDDTADAATDAAMQGDDDLVLLDVLDATSQRQAGRQLLRLAHRRTADGAVLAVIGSSGVEYALARTAPPAARPAVDVPGRIEQTLVIAGSRSPATDAQIAAARAEGFADVLVDPHAVTGADADAAITDVVHRAALAYRGGGHVLVHTPKKTGDGDVDGIALASALGRIAGVLVREVAARRLVVAGGDTSGFVTRSLAIDALRIIQPLAPGAPLCRVSSDDSAFDGMELCLKSGQVGAPDYFVRIAALGA
ncbi:four-carbon acid sugar kinase family protein [Herbiconiux sp. L3-i23]|uniref:four-carbon acid sugar kinase family protein n=1 Tax=Herbiconiux sp. L3-i23 TaxID=2905871 RepID=UPI00206A4012|nr:four-carbon acid sugar kinase family protein [Herbiconiux sp. L3-i23]BDI22770.1 hypothetical protein L3i23_15460 [Herbiconiux sp. L3-i23]